MTDNGSATAQRQIHHPSRSSSFHPAPAPSLAHLAYRPDIDGLRAVAILSVLVFHAFPTVLRGGFVGVDIFFVISGFLISSIIFRSLQRGDFNFAAFYGHRTRRIFPALILVMATCYGVGWFQLLPDEFRQLGKHMAAGAGFVQNFVLWREAGYFDNASEAKPLMHLWSLAIEEQFYLVFPVLIWAAWRRGWNLLTPVLAMALLSFGLNLVGVRFDAVGTFFLPQTRFWELLAGAALAHAQLFRREAFYAGVQRWLFPPRLFRTPVGAADREQASRSLLSLLSLGLILVALFGISARKQFPGWWALAPVAGAFGLILAGPGAWVNRRLLASRFMVFVGTISYPLYLWHWPILSFARIAVAQTPNLATRVGAMALSFVLAWLTYRLIERPIRFGRKQGSRTAGITLLLALVGYVGWNAYHRDGLAFREKNKEMNALYKITDPYAYFDYRTLMRVGVCHSVTVRVATENGCIRDGTEGIFLWGDSYAAALFSGAQDLARRRGDGTVVSQLTDGNGPPFFRDDLLTDEGKTLAEANGDRLEAVRRVRPRVVLIAWMAFGLNAYSDPALAVASLAETVQRIKAASPGSRVVVVGPVPEWVGSLQKQMIGFYHLHGVAPPVYMAFGLDPAIKPWDSYLQQHLPPLGIDYVSAYDALCNPAGCLTRASDRLTDLSAVDWGHLSRSGSVFLFDKIEASVFAPPAP
ncbi:MAG: hypothetical protein JWP29_3998 [Rhodoferax sp.]|nr:hypothetical protein [Rhodoferax sp.]